MEQQSETQQTEEQPQIVEGTETTIQPEIEAAKFLSAALPQFRTKLEGITGNQAKRVLAALIESPLEKETPGFTTKEAEDLFMLGLYISNAKFILFNVSLKNQELTQNIEEKSAEAAIKDDAVSNNESQGEVVNG
jgi:hypothetical protein